MRILGIALIVLGAVALIYGGFSYTKREKVIDVGPIEATVESKERVPLSPLAGGLAVVAGIALLATTRRKS